MRLGVAFGGDHDGWYTTESYSGNLRASEFRTVAGYLEVTDAHVLGAAASLAMLSPVGEPLLRIEDLSSHQESKVNIKR